MFWSKHISILFYLIRAQSRSTLFPYTTLFRSKPKDMPSLVAGIAGHVKRDALIITLAAGVRTAFVEKADRKSTRLNSSHLGISYAVFCLKKKNNKLKHRVFCLTQTLAADESFR